MCDTSFCFFRGGAVLSAKEIEKSKEEIDTVKLDAVRINSIDDSISESGISEGILSKGVASGPLDNKSVIDMPYQVNTITRELLDNQSVQSFDEAVKYFPSAQLQYRGGGEQGRPQTRGFQGSVVGNSFWDGFYSVSTTAIPMAMFESLQVQNGLSGSLYGGQEPSGTFSYSRKRPIKDYNAVWFDYITRGNVGVGWDTSNKFSKMGYRGVFFTTGGEREPRGADTTRQLASLALDFYPFEKLTIETNFSHYKHIMSGYYGSARVASVGGIATGEIPGVTSVAPTPLYTTNAQGVTSLNERYMKTTTASAKFKYAPFDALYFEGGYQWQEAIRSRDSTSKFIVPSAFLKAQSEFQTGFISHNISASLNGYQWKSGANSSLLGDMKNVGLLYDIGLGEHFEIILSGANSWFKNTNYNKSGLSYAGSLMYKIIPSTLNVYFTYADSLKEGSSKFYDPSDANYQNHPLRGQTIVFEPYRSVQYELGLKARVYDLDISAAIFQVTRPTYYEADDGQGNSVFGRQGEQRSRGIELTLGGQIIEYISVFGGVSYLEALMHKAANPVVENKTMIGEPRVQTNVLFDFAVPYTNKLSFTTNFHYTGKRYVDELNTKSVDGYFTMDLGMRYTTREWAGREMTIRLNINNLFNERYWVGMFPGSLDGQVTSSGTNLFRGYDRTYMISAQIKF